MISMGIDAVEICRFFNWPKYLQKQLYKIFNQSEIDYCLKIPVKAYERFAAHFAAKEACYKALSPLLKNQVNFLYFCKNVTVKKDIITHAPVLEINWAILNLKINYKKIKTILSITHTKNIAIASVIISI